MKDALAAYDEFFASFVTGNHSSLAALFAPDALFYGTSSPELVTSHEGVVSYFTRALSAARGEVKATSLEREALVLSDSVVAISGKWRFERTFEGTTVATGPYRVTAVLQKRAEQWLIVQFHNSPMPLPVPVPVTPAAS